MNVPNARAVIEDRQGRIWVGTGGEGLLCWEGGQWKRYSDKDGLISNYILALFVDTEGNLWVSTYGGGLSRWHDGRFLNYTTKNGLADDFITHISEDRNGWYWMGSSQKGIFRVARQQFEAFSRGEIQRLTSITYNRSDGLPSLDCNWTCQPAGWTARDGRLLLPTLSRGGESLAARARIIGRIGQRAGLQADCGRTGHQHRNPARLHQERLSQAPRSLARGGRGQVREELGQIRLSAARPQLSPHTCPPMNMGMADLLKPDNYVSHKCFP